jgi:hypothetical protein
MLCFSRNKELKNGAGFEKVGNDPIEIVKGFGWPLRASKGWNPQRSGGNK